MSSISVSYGWSSLKKWAHEFSFSMKQYKVDTYCSPILLFIFPAALSNDVKDVNAFS